MLSHTKELTVGRRPVPAGTGMLPWSFIVETLEGAGFDGTMVIHGLAEADVSTAVGTLRRVLADRGSR